MSQALFQYPKKSAFGSVIPKSKIYEKASPSRVVREKFVSQVDKIIWQYKLSPETINLSSRPNVPEIDIFSILLKTPELSEDVLRCIDQAIPLPIFFQLTFDHRIKMIAAYKRPSDADASKWVVDTYFETPWQPENSARMTLPLALDLEGLYEKMLFNLISQPPRSGESLKSMVERLKLIRVKQIEYHKIEALLLKEKQFNRKVELNAQLRSLKNELEILSS
jgi:hypothetical protein